jgi:asparagine synthase (glutamine-hydrolysing)
MCGFVAIVSPEKRLEGILPRLVQATRRIAHRGPDDEAFYVSPTFSAGFRRLSIIDRTDSSRQPMSDASQRYWIVFNGEIYNYKELRTELLHSGARFRTIGDTEVLLAAYIKWGQDCLSRLNGMFSFLIWDSVDHVLFGARDRFGEKPLFYAKTKEGIAFASEIKGISPLLSAGLEHNLQFLG